MGVLVFRIGRPLLVGLITGALGTLLFTGLVQERMPPLHWAARYALLALLTMAAHITLRRLHEQHSTSYVVLITSAIAGALVGFMLLKGYEP